MQQQIENKLVQAFKPDFIKLYDKSESHKNHPEALKNGGSHLTLILVSSAFEGLKTIQRQRKIHKLLADELKPGGGLHALSMSLYTTQEWQKKHEQPE